MEIIDQMLADSIRGTIKRESDLEILEQETNHRTFLNNFLRQEPYLVSNCCSAPVQMYNETEGRCEDCGEHCGAVEIKE